MTTRLAVKTHSNTGLSTARHQILNKHKIRFKTNSAPDLECFNVRELENLINKCLSKADRL